MLCPICGRENPDGARFCRACGTSLAAPEPAPMPPDPQSQPQSQAQSQPQATSYPSWSQQPPAYQPNYAYAPNGPTVRQGAGVSTWLMRLFALLAALAMFLPFAGSEMLETSFSGFQTAREVFEDELQRSLLEDDLTIVFLLSTFLPVLVFLVSWIPRKAGALLTLLLSLIAAGASAYMVYAVIDTFGGIGKIDFGFGVTMTVGLSSLGALIGSLLTLILSIPALLRTSKS